MRAEELTIGCNVVFDTWICRVDQINPPDIGVSYGWHEACAHVDKLKPIPITEALLLSNGFVKSEDIFFVKEYGSVFIRTFNYVHSGYSGWNVNIYIIGSEYCDCHIEYVHQMQALCALAGIKLELNFN